MKTFGCPADLDFDCSVLGADFVCDVTVPDGMLVLPGQHLTKIWRVCNSGTLPWGDCTKVSNSYTSFLLLVILIAVLKHLGCLL